MDRRSRPFKPFYGHSLFFHSVFTKRSQMYHEFGALLSCYFYADMLQFR